MISRLEPGHEATFVLLPGDPAVDFDQALAPSAVYRAGERIWPRPD